MIVGFGRGDFLGMALSQEGKKHKRSYRNLVGTDGWGSCLYLKKANFEDKGRKINEDSQTQILGNT